MVPTKKEKQNDQVSVVAEDAENPSTMRHTSNNAPSTSGEVPSAEPVVDVAAPPNHSDSEEEEAGDYVRGEEDERTVSMCGRHLATFVYFFKKRVKSKIRIRTDIFEPEEPEGETLRLWTKLETVRVDGVIQLAGVIQDLQSPDRGRNLDALKATLSAAIRATEELKLRLGELTEKLDMEDTEIEIVPKSRVLTFEAATTYMDGLMKCLELEPRIFPEWKTAFGLLKYRIGRVLRNCTHWENNSFLMNYCRDMQETRLKLYTAAVDYVNSISTTQNPFAVLDDEKVGWPEFKHMLEVFTNKATSNVIVTNTGAATDSDETETVEQTNLNQETQNPPTSDAVPTSAASSVALTDSRKRSAAAMEGTTIAAIPSTSSIQSCSTSSLTLGTQNQAFQDTVPSTSTNVPPAVIMKKYKNKGPKRVMAATVSDDVSLGNNVSSIPSTSSQAQAFAGPTGNQIPRPQGALNLVVGRPVSARTILNMANQGGGIVQRPNTHHNSQNQMHNNYFVSYTSEQIPRAPVQLARYSGPQRGAVQSFNTGQSPYNRLPAAQPLHPYYQRQQQQQRWPRGN